MQNDVLSQISKLREIEEVVVFTHNIDFIFLQTVFISALKKCGNPNLTVLADSQCAIDSYQSQSSLLSGLGSRYRVIPVQVKPGFRFHPKAILLSGKKSATLFVGSGNLTFGGMRENAEVWSKFTLDDGVEKISGFRDYIQSILPMVGFPEEAERDLADAFSPERNSWVSDLPEAEDVWISPGSNESLFDHIVRRVIGKQLNKLTVCTPYFDSEAQALQELVTKLGDIPTEVYIQSGRSTLLQHAADKLPESISIKSVKPLRSGEQSNRFIHAKWFAIEHSTGIDFFHGSANCSKAALTGQEPFSNAEIMVCSTIMKEEFEESILSDLHVEDTVPLLAHELSDDDGDITSAITLESARYEYGTLRIAYRTPDEVVLSELRVDKNLVDFEQREQRQVIAQLTDQPRDVVLLGMLDGVQIESNHIWVDDDSKLRSNAASRNIIEVIRGAQDDDGHDPSKWLLVFNLVGKNLSDLGTHEVKRAEGNTEEKMAVSTDVLTSPDYSAFRALPTHHIGMSSNANIYSLLLSVFGISGRLEAEVKPETENGEEDEVDRQDQIPSPARPAATRIVTDREKERITNIAINIVDRLCEAEYLRGRDPNRLSLDLQVIALLLRKAYSMNWLDNGLYQTLSHKVWSNLFFHTKEHKGKGWLEVRAANGEGREPFLQQLVTPMLTAALYAWFSAVPYDPSDAYSRRFQLSQIMAMGRCSWLWKFDDETANQIAQNLKQIWVDSPCGEQTLAAHEVFERFAREVNHHGLLGIALVKMEAELGGLPIADVRTASSTAEVNRGDLLWQGSKGLCVAMAGSKESDRIDVLSLQDPESSNQFLTQYLIPMKGLMDNIHKLCGSLTLEEIETIENFVAEFKGMVVG